MSRLKIQNPSGASQDGQRPGQGLRVLEGNEALLAAMKDAPAESSGQILRKIENKKNNQSPNGGKKENVMSKSNTQTGTERGAAAGIAPVPSPTQAPTVPTPAPAKAAPTHLAAKAQARQTASSEVRLSRDEVGALLPRLQVFGKVTKGIYPVSDGVKIRLSHDGVDIRQFGEFGEFEIHVPATMVSSVIMMIALVADKIEGMTSRSERGVTVAIEGGWMVIRVVSTSTAQGPVVERESAKVQAQAETPQPAPATATSERRNAVLQRLADKAESGTAKPTPAPVVQEQERIEKARAADKEEAYRAKREASLEAGRKVLPKIFASRKGAKKLVEGCMVEGKFIVPEIIALHGGTCGMKDETCAGEPRNVTVLGEYSWNFCSHHGAAAPEVRAGIQRAAAEKRRAEEEKAVEAGEKAREAVKAELEENPEGFLMHDLTESGIQFWSLSDVMSRKFPDQAVPFVDFRSMKTDGPDPRTGEMLEGARGFMIHVPSRDGRGRMDMAGYRPVSRATFALGCELTLPADHYMVAQWDVVEFVKSRYASVQQDETPLEAPERRKRHSISKKGQKKPPTLTPEEKKAAQAKKLEEQAAKRLLPGYGAAKPKEKAEKSKKGGKSPKS